MRLPTCLLKRDTLGVCLGKISQEKPGKEVYFVVVVVVVKAKRTNTNKSQWLPIPGIGGIVSPEIRGSGDGERPWVLPDATGVGPGIPIDTLMH